MDISALLGPFTIEDDDPEKAKRQMVTSRGRTEDKVLDALMTSVCNSVSVTGYGESEMMTIHLIRESIRNPQVEANFRAVAKDLLHIFPPGQENRWVNGDLDELTGYTHKPVKDERTINSIATDIIGAIERRKPVVGHSDKNRGLNRLALLTRAVEGDAEFKTALETVASKILGVFPLEQPANESEPATV